MIPPSYRVATWRCTLPSDGECIAVAFDVDGAVVRLKIPLRDARHLRDTLTDYLAIQTKGSAGMPR